VLSAGDQTGEGMIESTERVEQFKADIAEMRLRDPATARDVQLQRLGAVLMVVGVAAAVIAYLLSHGTSNQLSQGDDTIIALGGVAAAVVGSALFLRYSLAQFLRFWLARLIYEQRAQTDRVLDARSPTGPPTNSATPVEPVSTEV
jgi:hypothetical protein